MINFPSRTGRWNDGSRLGGYSYRDYQVSSCIRILRSMDKETYKRTTDEPLVCVLDARSGLILFSVIVVMVKKKSLRLGPLALNGSVKGHKSNTPNPTGCLRRTHYFYFF